MAIAPYDERLDRLLDTAARVFAEKGYHPTTMRDLARATGMSLAGMYYYVPSKDDLLYLIQERCFQEVLEGAEATLRDAGSPYERLQRFIRHHVTFFARHMPAMKVLSHEAGALDADRDAKIDALKRRYVTILEGLLIELGLPPDTATTRVAGFALFGMMNWIYTWYRLDGAVAPEGLADQIGSIFLNGVLDTSSTSAPQGG